ncbi:MAG: endonuclease/exonuclease/phosphatase family protein [Myxococcales bacterium]|nr:endonuclease/exonuclease/phosphatase family protein [Myxococcales bacterium]
MTFNTWGVLGVEPERARRLAQRIRDHARGFDVVLLNEVWGTGSNEPSSTAGGIFGAVVGWFLGGPGGAVAGGTLGSTLAGKPVPRSSGRAQRDEYYDILKDEFPYVIYMTLGPGAGKLWGLGKDATDSGLMAFSRYPFVEAQNDGNTYPGDMGSVVAISNGVFINPDPYIRFLEFNHSCGSTTDQLAAKGVVLFHIAPPGGRINIALTHTQAESSECAVAARERQLHYIRALIDDRVSPSRNQTTIIAGDLNIDGYIARDDSAESPGTAPRAEEYRRRIWGNLDSRPYFDAWRTTSPRDEGTTYNMGEYGGDLNTGYVGARRFDYFLLNGDGYHAPGALTWAAGTPSFPYATFSEPNARCVNWIRTTLHSTTSDHVGLAMELGPRAAFCNPAMATLPRTNGTPFGVALPTPGADAWFRLPPGTYTLGLAKGEVESGMRLDVFSAENLSQPLRPLPRRQRVLTVEPARCSAGTVRNRVPCTYETDRFFGGDGELYLRVYSPDGLTYGEASLLVLKHDCASEDTACELLPAKPLTPAVPLNKPYTGYFTFSSIATANPRVPQTLVFQGTTLDGTDPRSPDLSLEREGLPVRSLLPSDSSAIAMTEEAHEANYLLKVSRPSDTTRYSVGVVTDLTYVSGAKDDLPPWMTAGISPPPSPIAFKLVCLEEGGLGIGDEELSVKVVADGVQVAGPIFRDDLDADEAMDLSAIPNFGFVKRAYLLIEEHDGDLVTDPVQDTATLELYKLDPMRPEGASHQQVITLHPVGDPRTLNGPTVQFQYHTSHSKVP